MLQTCPQCGLKFSESPALAGVERCPSCGTRLAPSPDEQSPSILITRYLSTVWQLITRPSSFFRAMPVSGGLSRPLAFALVTHWIGSALGFLWLALIGGRLARFFDGWRQISSEVAEVDNPGRAARWMEATDQLSVWFKNAAPVIIDPFLTLLSVFFTSLLVYVGARLLVTPGKNGAPQLITYESAIRIVCFGMAPAILAGLPIFGFGVASFLTIVITVIGAKEVYRTGVLRAIVIALFPKLLFLALLLTGIVVLGLLLVKFLSSFIF
ncbi:MAG: hypothetical protein NDJ90_10405 [Oligoflexia bacterium]|nr:hypothetical protein [Oligoflexia bacterium]